MELKWFPDSRGSIGGNLGIEVWDMENLEIWKSSDRGEPEAKGVLYEHETPTAHFILESPADAAGMVFYDENDMYEYLETLRDWKAEEKQDE